MRRSGQQRPTFRISTMVGTCKTGRGRQKGDFCRVGTDTGLSGESKVGCQVCGALITGVNIIIKVCFFGQAAGSGEDVRVVNKLHALPLAHLRQVDVGLLDSPGEGVVHATGGEDGGEGQSGSGEGCSQKVTKFSPFFNGDDV